jgi:predicted amidophosphoribosyltransferase
VQLFKCGGCEAPLSWPSALCQTCEWLVQQWHSVSWCPDCQSHPADQLCERPWRKSSVIDAQWMMYPAHAPLQRVVRRWKLQGGGALDRLLVASWLSSPAGHRFRASTRATAVLAIPQPLRRRAELQGGSALRLATTVARSIQQPLVRTQIKLAAKPAKQSRSQEHERRARREIIIKPNQLKGKLLLVDDLQTSGETLEQLADRIRTTQPRVSRVETLVLAYRAKELRSDRWIGSEADAIGVAGFGV